MGWTSYHTTHYKKNGDVDRKESIESDIIDYKCFRVEKSTMVGSIYYAAIRRIAKYEKDSIRMLPENEQYVFGSVVLTGASKTDYWNFSYKEVSEDMGPGYFDCPESILNLLSETDNEYALSWRENCRNYQKEKKSKRASRNRLNTLPDGTVIEFISNSNYGNGRVSKGDTVRLRKWTVYRKGKPISRWFYDSFTYWINKNLPTEFSVVV